MASVARLGEALVQAGLIDQFQLKSALGQQRRWGGRIGKALIDLGFIDESTLIKFLSEQLKFSAIDLSRSKIAPKTYQALPKRIAEKYMAIPVVIKDTPAKRTLVLAMADPTDLKAIDEIEFLTNFKIEPVVALESAIVNVLKHYGEEAPPPAENPHGVTLVDSGVGRLEVVHGEVQQVAEAQAKYGVEGAAYSDATPPPVSPAPPQPGAEVQGESEFDFSRYSQEGTEQAPAEPARVEDDTPLEMSPPEVAGAPVAQAIAEPDVLESAEPIEEAETLDDTKPPVMVPAPAAEAQSHPATITLPEVPIDPDNFLPPERQPDEDDFFDIAAQTAKVLLASQDQAMEDAETVEEAEEITEVVEQADAEMVAAEPIVPEDAIVDQPAYEEAVAEAEPVHDAGGEVAEAEPVHDAGGEVAEAEQVHEEGGEVSEAEQVHEEGDEVAEAEPVHDAGDEVAEAAPVHDDGDVAEAVEAEEAESVEDQHAALDAFWSTEEVAEEVPEATEMVAEPAYGEPMAEAQEVFAETATEEPMAYAEPEAAAQPLEIPEPPSAEHVAEAVPAEPEGAIDIEHELRAIHTEIWEMKQKIENFITLFALKEQGKISLEEFLEELRKP